MSKCTNCGAELDPAWKFCIVCGTSVPRSDGAEAAPEIVAPPRAPETPPGPPAPAVSEASVSEAPAEEPPVTTAIPAAVRPSAEDDFDDEYDDVPRARKPDVAVLIGVAVTVIGIALIVTVAIVLFSPHG
ncbi:MAG TPA: zinc ribbon domain-containing protein [Lacisediminihabitans sp.]|uniref:zinc ribbon domain-containing protein n=1 Tax=Lacisediminihabitans sp. TaxID=2787631 RepID=UPI002ED79D80